MQKYMPGAGGIFSTNHIANSTKQDGLTVGGVGTSIYANAILGAHGTRYQVKYLFFFRSSPLQGARIRLGYGQG